MREVRLVAKCDECGVSDEETAVNLATWNWDGESWETDLCATDKKRWDDVFDQLKELSRKHTVETKTSSPPKRRKVRRPRGELEKYRDKESGLYHCPGTEVNGKRERCFRTFDRPQALGVHYTRTHGEIIP